MISICKIANRWLRIFFSNEKKVSQVRWKSYCARGKAGRRQPSCRGFGFLLIFLLFLFLLWLLDVDVAVLVLFFARPITTPGSVARERNWPEVETRLRVYSINFPFIPIFYLTTLKWYCRPTKKVKTYETSRWNNQFAFPWEVGMYWNFTTSREKGRFFTELYTISLSQIGQRAIGCPGLDTPFGTVEKPNWPHRFFSVIKMILMITFTFDITIAIIMRTLLWPWLHVLVPRNTNSPIFGSPAMNCSRNM